MDSSVPGNDVCLEIKDDGIHLIFKTNADAIEMMPKASSIFTRKNNVIVMARNPEMDKHIELSLNQKQEEGDDDE